MNHAPGRPEEPLLGLEPGVNRLRPYTVRWSELFIVEAKAIRDALGALARDVQHVGSTAVPGLSAKPILDIAVAVARLEDFRRCVGPFTALGYEHVPGVGIPNNEVFGKGASRTHLLHIVEFDSDEWCNYLKFRDRLRREPVLAQRYEALKADLIRAHPTDRAAYTAGKHAFHPSRSGGGLTWRSTGRPGTWLLSRERLRPGAG